MTDTITSCIMHKNQNNVIQAYEVTFSFDGVDVPSPHDVVFVVASSLQDPTDLNAVKADAINQARAIKAFYVNSTDVSDLVGPVTL
jgi:hypothetical protein